MVRIDYDDDKGALFSPGRRFRYRLWRVWDRDKDTVLFVMLNPSTADEDTLDPTCTRCRAYAERWGYGKLYVGNIFAYRATDPDDLPDATLRGSSVYNDIHLLQMAERADLIVCAWGANGELEDRGREVAQLLDDEGHTLWHLGLTLDGQPKHPLYLPGERNPEPFHPEMID